MTLNVLSYQHQHQYAPAPGMCQAAPAFNNNLHAPALLKRSATTISSAHRLRTRLMSQDPTTCSSAPSSTTSTPYSKRPRSPAREALHASVSKHLTSSSGPSRSAGSRSSSSAAAARSRSSSNLSSSTAPSVPAAPAVAPVVPSAQNLANPHLIVATLLVRIAQANDALLARASPLASTDRGAAALLAAASKFQGRAPPTISLPAYAARLARYAPVPAAGWVATLIAIDRVANAPTPASSSVDGGTAVPPVVVCSHNVHRVLLLALAIATKVHSDAFYTNKHLAKVGGVGLAELNRLELEFLFLSGFNVNVTVAEYARYTDRLAAYASAVQQQWAAKAAASAEAVPRVHSVDLVAHQRPMPHEGHGVQQQQQQRHHHQQHSKSAPAALGVLVSPPCSPTPSCSSSVSSASSASSCYSAGAVVCTAPGQRQVVWSTPPMSPPRHLMAADPMVLSPMAVDLRE